MNASMQNHGRPCTFAVVLAMTTAALVMVANVPGACGVSSGPSLLYATCQNTNSELCNNNTYVQQLGFNFVGGPGLGLVPSFHWLSSRIFPANSSAEAWREQQAAKAAEQIKAIRSAGLQIVSTMDIFIWPKTLVDMYADDIVDPKTKHIVVNNKSMEILSGMFDELITTYPDVQAYMIRVGENYLPGTDIFVGNSAVDFSKPFPVQQDQYVQLIQTLRSAISVKHNRTFVFRTWDTSGFSPSRPKRFHPSLAYYLNVTDRIQPHPNLVFSIKHVQLDFWRYVNFNPSLGQGKHRQLVEVECAREYEGKGALPSYIAKGVIEGFDEVTPQLGLRDIITNNLTAGIWLWTSGGGWGGPDVKSNDIWPKANALVILRWYQMTSAALQLRSPSLPSKRDAFDAFCRSDLGLSSNDCSAFHNASVLSQSSVLAMRYCNAYDKTLNGEYMPTNNWLRDDRLGGLQQLDDLSYGTGNIFKFLYDHKLFDEVMAEKQSAVGISDEIVTLVDSMSTSAIKTQLNMTATYGSLLSQFIASGWKVLTLGFQGDQEGHYNKTALIEAIGAYDIARQTYNAFAQQVSGQVSPFYPYYEDINTNGSHITHAPGLNASVNVYRNVTARWL